MRNWRLIAFMTLFALFWLILGYFGAGMCLYRDHHRSPFIYLPEEPKDILDHYRLIGMGLVSFSGMIYINLKDYLSFEELHFGFKNPFVVHKK